MLVRPTHFVVVVVDEDGGVIGAGREPAPLLQLVQSHRVLDDVVEQGHRQIGVALPPMVDQVGRKPGHGLVRRDEQRVRTWKRTGMSVVGTVEMHNGLLANAKETLGNDYSYF